MKKIKARIRALVSNPKNDIRKDHAALIKLKQDIQNISPNLTYVEKLVKLFEIIAPLYDENNFNKTLANLQKKNYGQIDYLVKWYELLIKHIENAGRYEFGVNRTKKGEQVTLDNVFLGNIYGLHTKQASYWLNSYKEKRLSEDVWHNINDYQSKNFFESHQAIIKIADNIVQFS